MKKEPHTKIIFPLAHSFLDYPNKAEHSLVVFFVGCHHNCYGCQNPELQDINYSKAFDFNIYKLINMLRLECVRMRTRNVVLTGGDPLAPHNLEFVKELLLFNKEFNFCIFTGYDIAYVRNNIVHGFKFIKTGKFIKDLHQISAKTDELYSLASTNQELYNHNFELLTTNGIYNFKEI